MWKLPVNGCCLPYVVDGVAIRDLATGGTRDDSSHCHIRDSRVAAFRWCHTGDNGVGARFFRGIDWRAGRRVRLFELRLWLWIRSTAGVFVLCPGARVFVLRTTCRGVLPTVWLRLSPVRVLPPLVAPGVPTSTR